jgi:two-component system chemotaxis response regulator CheB
MRSLLRAVVSRDAGLEVAGTAADGDAALRMIASTGFDVVLLDVEMPVKDGLATIRELRARGHRMPVIMCSSLTQRGASVTIEALAGGASDYVAKPSGQFGREAATEALAQGWICRIGFDAGFSNVCGRIALSASACSRAGDEGATNDGDPGGAGDWGFDGWAGGS